VTKNKSINSTSEITTKPTEVIFNEIAPFDELGKFAYNHNHDQNKAA